MRDHMIRDVQHSYDAVADEYGRRFFEELEHKPLDRRLLDRFVARVQYCPQQRLAFRFSDWAGFFAWPGGRHTACACYIACIMSASVISGKSRLFRLVGLG
jgi:hypothetical protein